MIAYVHKIWTCVIRNVSIVEIYELGDVEMITVNKPEFLVYDLCLLPTIMVLHKI